MTTTTDVVAVSRVVDEVASRNETGDGSAVRSRSRLRCCERGMVSAEWAVGLIAAIAIAGVLVSIVTSGPVRDSLLHVILNVISWISGTLSGLR